MSGFGELLDKQQSENKSLGAFRPNRILGVRVKQESESWTGAQLAEALRADGIDLSGRQVRRYLRLLKAGYRRTASTLEHKQDPAKVQHKFTTMEDLYENLLRGLRARATV